MKIKEAAEEASPYQSSQDIYIASVTHYLEFMKSQGYAMLKAGGDANDVAFELVKKHLDRMQNLPAHTEPRILSDTLKQTLTIGEERGRRFAEWAEANCAQKFEGTWVSVLMFQGTKTTSELWEIAEKAGIFNDKNK